MSLDDDDDDAAYPEDECKEGPILTATSSSPACGYSNLSTNILQLPANISFLFRRKWTTAHSCRIGLYDADDVLDVEGIERKTLDASSYKSQGSVLL